MMGVKRGVGVERQIRLSCVGLMYLKEVTYLTLCLIWQIHATDKKTHRHAAESCNRLTFFWHTYFCIHLKMIKVQSISLFLTHQYAHWRLFFLPLKPPKQRRHLHQHGC